MTSSRLVINTINATKETKAVEAKQDHMARDPLDIDHEPIQWTAIQIYLDHEYRPQERAHLLSVSKMEVC